MTQTHGARPPLGAALLLALTTGPAVLGTITVAGARATFGNEGKLSAAAGGNASATRPPNTANDAGTSVMPQPMRGDDYVSLGGRQSQEPPYSFSLLVDENAGGSCIATGWEWVGVTSVAGWVPQGSNLIVPNDAVWQTVDVPLDNPALVRASTYGGNGVLGPSSTGYYTMDSVWFTLGPGLDPADPNNQGPFEILLDAIQYLDPNGAATTIIDEEGIDQFSFARGTAQIPSFTYGLTSAGSYDGTRSHRTTWGYNSDVTSLGELQRIGGACGSQPWIPATATTIRFHVVARGKPTAPGVPLPTVLGPILGTQAGVRVNFDPNAALPTSVQVYVNSVAAGSSAALDPNHPLYLDFTGLTIAPGDSVSAKQVVAGHTSDFAYPRASSDPAPPSVQSPLCPAGTVVTVTNILNVPFARASQVNVIVRNTNGTVAQNVPKVLDPNAVMTTTVTVTALLPFQTVTATQTVNAAISRESAAVTVTVPAPTIFAAPSSETTLIKLQDCDPTATDALICVYSQPPADPNQPVESNPNAVLVNQLHGTFDPGNHSIAYVNVTGQLTAGQVVTARQVVSGVESSNSFWDPVTGTSVIPFTPSGLGPPAPDTMESYTGQNSGVVPFENPTYPAIQPADHGWWGTGRNPTLRWTGDPNFLATYPGKRKNATPGGQFSVYSPATCSPQVDPNDTDCGANTDGWRCNFDTSYPDPNWAVLMDMTWTPTEPLIFSIAIYDVGGAGFDNLRQFASIASYAGGTLSQLISVGMPGSYYFAAINNNYYSARVAYGGGPGYVDLDWPGAPQRTVGWHTITTVLKRTRTDFYVDGVLAKKNVINRYPKYNNLYMGGGVPGYECWYDDFYFWKGAVGFVARLPNFPIVDGPITAEETTVLLSRIETGVTNVTVYANDFAHPIGSANPNGQSTAVVPVTALVKGDMIRAVATDANGASELGPGLEVGGHNGALLVCLGIRETGDSGALGSTGGTTGQIEWIAASGTFAAIPPATAAPIGTKRLTLQDGWQTITFDPSVDPLLAYPGSGDGIITATRGILEHVAFTVDPNDPLKSSGPYTLYVDDVINIGAGPGGSDFLITGFEGLPPPAEVLFQEPSYSGSSRSNLATPPDLSASSAEQALTGRQSERLSWFFKDTAAGRWLRLTTDGATHLSRPIIDLTEPIQMSFRLTAASAPTGACCAGYACTTQTAAQCATASGSFKGVGTSCTSGVCACRADTNCDGQISYADINPFVQALGNLSAWQAAHPTCPWHNCDINADGVVSFADINPFVAKLSSPGPCP